MAAVAFQNDYTNALVSGYDAFKPDILDELFRRYGKQGVETMMLIKTLGWEVPVAANSYSQFEEDYIHENFVVSGSDGAPGAGASQTITIATTSLTSAGLGYKHYPRVGDNVLYPNFAVGVITAIADSGTSSPDLTIYPSGATDALPAVTDGDTLVIFSNTFPYGSGQPQGRFAGMLKYTGYLKEIKESVEADGDMLADRTWFNLMPVTNEVSGETWGYYKKALVDLDYRMMLFMGGAITFDRLVTNTNVTATGLGTEGLYHVSNRLGNPYPFTPGTLTMPDFDAWELLLAANFVEASEIAMFEGLKFYQELQNLLVSYNYDTGIDNSIDAVANNLFGGDKGKAMLINWAYLFKSGRRYMFKMMKDWSNPKTYGTTGYKTQDLCLMIPADKKADVKTKAMLPSFGIRYKALGDYSRKLEVWDIAGAGGQSKYVTDVDQIKHHARAHIGAQHIAANRFIVVNPN